MPSATAPHYQLAVMCKHDTHFRHTHTGDDRNKCFALSLKVIEQLFFYYFASEVNGNFQKLYDLSALHFISTFNSHE